MQPSIEEVEKRAAQPLMSDPAAQEYFLNGLGPILGEDGPRPLDFSKAVVISQISNHANP